MGLLMQCDEAMKDSLPVPTGTGMPLPVRFAINNRAARFLACSFSDERHHTMAEAINGGAVWTAGKSDEVVPKEINTKKVPYVVINEGQRFAWSDFCSVAVHDNDPAIKETKEDVDNADTITHLELYHGSIDTALCLRLHQLHCLSSLRVCGTNLSASNVRMFCGAPAMPHWHNLQCLDLSHHVALGPRGIKLLVECCKSVRMPLQILRLRDTRMGPFGAQSLGAASATLLSSSPTLHTLDLGQNNLGPDGMWKLAGRLVQLHSLRILLLDHNNLMDDGCRQVANNLPASCLTTLDLSGNSIGDVGVAQLIPQLARRNTVELLNVSHNSMTAASATILAAHVAPMTCLHELNLSYNDLGDAGVVALVNGGLVHGTNVRTLHLMRTNVGDEGVGALVEHLDNMPSLQTLHLDHNDAASEARLRIVRLLLQHRGRERGTRAPPSRSPANSRRPSMMGSSHHGHDHSTRRLLLSDSSVHHTAGDGSEEDDESYNDDDPTEDRTMSEFTNRDIGRDSGMAQAAVAEGQHILASLSWDAAASELTTLPYQYVKHVMSAAAAASLQQQQQQQQSNAVTLPISGNGKNSSNGPTTLLSQGAFGKLYAGVDEQKMLSDNGLTMATHHLLLRRLTLGPAGAMAEVRQTILDHELPQLRHDHLLPLLAYSAVPHQPGSLVLVYDAGLAARPLRSMHACMAEQQMRAMFTWQRRVHVAIGVARALDFLHTSMRKGQFHGDVCSANIVLSPPDNTPRTMTVRLADAGLTRLVGTDRRRLAKSNELIFGSRGYRCPRYERGSCKYGIKSDMFALGIVVAELLTGRLQRSPNGPGGMAVDVYYDTIMASPEPRQFKADPLAGPLPEGAAGSQVIKTLGHVIVSCLSASPGDRPTAETVAEVLENLKISSRE